MMVIMPLTNHEAFSPASRDTGQSEGEAEDAEAKRGKEGVMEAFRNWGWLIGMSATIVVLITWAARACSAP